ncbi:MAG: sugar phosphate nucleotidyltransferase [Chlamydiales bacterium]|nr:sugar phosphate nucleotidyltransferase [Chlamydiales bacterium]
MLSTTTRTEIVGTTTIQQSTHAAVDMKSVTCVILGGGQGTRLFPLTHARSKPALPFGGRYRLIDVPLSNALNSGCSRIFVVTQFLSTVLHRHICSTYQPRFAGRCNIEILAAEQKPNNEQWFLGTADSVRKSLEYLLESPAEYFLILSGDQLYQMNYQAMLAFAQETDADLVIAALPVDVTSAQRMGILKVDNKCQITDFVEKTSDKGILERFRCPTNLLEKLGHSQTDQPFYLGSMGIYMFKRQALVKLLNEDSREDFGKHLIPTKVAQGRTAAFLFDGYWEDIGTIESFYNANMALTRPEPFFSFYDEVNPLYTNSHYLPAPKIFDARLVHSVICEGSVIEAKEIRNSILGPRAIIKHGSIIRDSYLMGNDYYTSPVSRSPMPDHTYVGRNCLIQNAIIDSNVCIGDNVQLVNTGKLQHYDGDKIFIRDGITVVTAGAHLPDNFTL